MFYYLSTLGVENGDESARFPMFWKRIDQRSPLPLSSPLPFSFLPPIFPGKRRKINWAVEPLEFSICPKLTPELSRPPRFRSFSEFLVSLSFFLSFLARRRTETEYLRAFYPLQKEGEELRRIVIPRGEKGLIYNFTGGTSLPGFGPPLSPPSFSEETRFNSRAKQNYARIPLCPTRSLYVQGEEEEGGL